MILLGLALLVAGLFGRRVLRAKRQPETKREGGRTAILEIAPAQRVAKCRTSSSSALPITVSDEVELPPKPKKAGKLKASKADKAEGETKAKKKPKTRSVGKKKYSKAAHDREAADAELLDHDGGAAEQHTTSTNTAEVEQGADVEQGGSQGEPSSKAPGAQLSAEVRERFNLDD